MRSSVAALAFAISACSATVRPHPAALLPRGHAEIVAVAGVGPARRSYYGFTTNVAATGRYSAAPLEFAAGVEHSQYTTTAVSADVRWGALQSGVAITPSLGVEGVFASAAQQWIPSAAVAVGTTGQWPVDASLTVRGALRDLLLPEVTFTPAVRFTARWFTATIAADVIIEPTVGNASFRPYIGFGALFDTGLGR